MSKKNYSHLKIAAIVENYVNYEKNKKTKNNNFELPLFLPKTLT